MTEFIAFYGSLMERARDGTAPSRAGLSRLVGPCRIAGVLRDHGRYPGFFPVSEAGREADGPPIVLAELHEIVGPHAFAIFDRWEDYDPEDEANSLYIRRKIRLVEPAEDAWVYLSQLSHEDPIVPGGDWARHPPGR